MNKTLKNVMQTIQDHGFQIYIVGGYVRDYCLNIESTDYDLATSATPQDLINIWGKNIVSINYGSVVLKYQHCIFEITTYRKDKNYQNNRFPTIEYAKNIDEDIKRRDFTINSLYMDIDLNIIDKVNGKKDILDKKIKMIGNPIERINEDALRILRAIRFATIYNFSLDNNLKVAIKELGYLVKNLSYERKKEELDKIFVSPNIKYGISLIKELGIDKYLEINLNNIVITNDLLIMWSQLDVLDKYPFKRHFKQQILKVKTLLKEDILSPINLYQYGLYISKCAGIIKGINIDDINQEYNKLPILFRHDIKITTKDIIDILNIEPSKKLGLIFNDIEKQIILKNIPNDKQKIIKYIVKKYHNET